MECVVKYGYNFDILLTKHYCWHLAIFLSVGDAGKCAISICFLFFFPVSTARAASSVSILLSSYRMQQEWSRSSALKLSLSCGTWARKLLRGSGWSRPPPDCVGWVLLLRCSSPLVLLRWFRRSRDGRCPAIRLCPWCALPPRNPRPSVSSVCPVFR